MESLIIRDPGRMGSGIMKKSKKKNRPSAGNRKPDPFTVEVSVKVSNSSHQAQALKETVINTVLQAPFRSRAVKAILESVH